MLLRLISLFLATMLLGFFPWIGHSAAAPQQAPQRALALWDALRAGDEAAALALMDDTMQKAMKGQAALMFQGLEAQVGKFEGAQEAVISQDAGYAIAELPLRFARATLVMRVALDAQGKVAGLFFKPAPAKTAAPQATAQADAPTTYVEKPLQVDAGTGYPLPGLLCLPAQGEITAAAVMVAGSGPQNMDEAIGPNAPLRDIAHGLARAGIATLRWDKRTLAFGQQLAKSADLARLTVEEETVQDAAAAIRLLRQQPQLAGKKVFVIGHSLGAMLASHIGQQAAADGYILLAGSPRKLWQIMADQNGLALEELRAQDAAQAQQGQAVVDGELKKAAALATMNDEEALRPGNLIFGMPAWYLRHLQRIDAAALHLADQKPLLVLWGGRDRQVLQADFDAWKERLAKHPDAAFLSYPTLNHLFGECTGQPMPFSQLVSVEYQQNTPVAQQVIGDMADWIVQRTK